MSCVDEEASDDAVPLLDIVAEDVHEFARGHRKVKLIGIHHLDTWANVGEADLAKRILIAFQIVKVVDEGVYEELICLF